MFGAFMFTHFRKRLTEHVLQCCLLFFVKNNINNFQNFVMNRVVLFVVVVAAASFVGRFVKLHL